MPHIDTTTIHGEVHKVKTTIACHRGEMLVWTWSDKEPDAEKLMKRMSRDHADEWIAQLAKLKSLCVWHVTPGFALTMPPGTVHMLLTVAQKEQLTWHEFM